MPNPVMNAFDAQGFDTTPKGSSRFGAHVARIGKPLGLGKLGCNFLVVEPGKRAFPFHNHLGCDELFIIVEGTGTYRFDEDEHEVGPGDCCAAPRGGPDKAHQLINTGTTDLKYYAISSMSDPEVVEYPDSGKFAALAISPGPDFMQAHLRFIGRVEDSMGYFEGEEL